MLIDTHCHLDFPDFEPERDAVVARARAAGLRNGLARGLRDAVISHTPDSAGVRRFLAAQQEDPPALSAALRELLGSA